MPNESRIEDQALRNECQRAAYEDVERKRWTGGGLAGRIGKGIRLAQLCKWRRMKTSMLATFQYCHIGLDDSSATAWFPCTGGFSSLKIHHSKSLRYFHGDVKMEKHPNHLELLHNDRELVVFLRWLPQLLLLALAIELEKCWTLTG